MGFLSQAGQLGFRSQASKGTYADPGAIAPNQGVFCRYTGGSINGNRELLIPDPEIGAGRDIPDAALGPVSFSGTYDMYMRMEELAFFLKACLGTAGDAVTTGVTTTTVTPATTIPWVSIEEKIGNGFEAFKYTDAKINTLHVEADAGGYLTGSVGVLAITQQAGITPTAAPRIDTSPLLLGTNITVSYNAVTLPAKSFSLDINNNLEDDDFRLGSLTLADVVEKRREIKMGVTVRPNDSTAWRQAMYGSSAATGPQGGAATKQQAIITITSYEDIPSGTPATKYSCTFTVPFAIIAPFNTTPSGDDVLQQDYEITSVLSTGTNIATAVVKHGYATTP